AFDEKTHSRTVRIGFTGGEQDRLVFRMRLLVGAMRYERSVGKGPEQAVQRVASFLADGLDRHTPAAPERALDQAGQSLIERRFRQMVEEDFRHALPVSRDGRRN